MKVCVINNLLEPYNRGGAGQVALNISLGLEKSGHEIFFISTKPFFTKPEKEKGSQKNYYIPSLFPYLNKICKPIRLFWHCWDCLNFINYFKIKKIIKKEKPDIIITHNLKGLGFLIPCAIKKSKIKHIHYLHDLQLLHPSGLMLFGKEKKLNSVFAKLYASICKRLFSSPDIIISPSEWLLKEHKKNNFFKESKQITLPNPAVLSHSHNSSEKKDKFRFLYVGEIEEHKGALFLTQAFWELKKTDAELILIGQGKKLNRLKKETRNQMNIKIMGWQKNEIVKQAMGKADVLIMPSECYENSPTVIYEAIGAGLPFIASRIGGTTELAKKYGGILFTPKNKNELKEKILYAMKNYEKIKKASLEGKLKIKELSLENYTKNLIKLIA